MKAVEYIISGTVQKVGYRDFVAKIGQQLGLDGIVENLDDGNVKIQCKGPDDKITKFKENIDVQEPDKAPLINVEKIIERDIEATDIKAKGFHEKIGDPAKEIAQGLSTGMNYINLFRENTNENFSNLDEKYGAISRNMGHIIEEWQKDREFSEKRFEKTEKNIEKLLKILSQKK